MLSRGKLLSTTLKVVKVLCYTTLKWIQKLHVFVNLGKLTTYNSQLGTHLLAFDVHFFFKTVIFHNFCVDP